MWSFPDNMFYHVWTTLLPDLSWWFQQRCSSLFVYLAMNSLFQHAWTSLSITLFKLASSTNVEAYQQHMFKLASSTMFKPVNNHVQAGQLNHVQACQQLCSSLSAQPCSSLSTTMFKLASSTMFTPVNRQKQAVRFYMCSFYLSIQLSINCRNNLHKILIHATT